MTPVPDSTVPPVQQLQATLSAMPPVKAMGIALRGFSGDQLQLSAPLAANVNDKGNAFGGSLASAMTLAGWALVTLRLRQAGFEADVYVADSQIRYLAPVYDDLLATATALPGADWDEFLSTFGRRGRARIPVRAVTGEDASPAAELEGRFVAMARG